MTPLRVALLGAAGIGESWLTALLAHPGYQVVAIADEDAEVAESAADACRAAHYDDFRMVLVEPRIDAAVFALPAHVAEPYLTIAADRGLPVLKETPLARSFDEAVRAVGAFFAADLPLVVASRWRFDVGLVGAVLNRAAIGDVQLAHAHVVGRLERARGWRGDLLQSGGGALLDVAYEAADMIVHLMGLPGDVLTQVGRLAVTAGERFDAEDTAAAILRYSNGAAATISAAWRPTGPLFELRLQGAAGQASLTRNTAHAVSPAGVDLAVRRLADGELLAAMLDSFAATVQTRPSAHPGRAADQLATCAVLEAAYLSSRTHAIESVTRAYEMAGMPLPRMTAPQPAPAV